MTEKEELVIDGIGRGASPRGVTPGGVTPTVAAPRAAGASRPETATKAAAVVPPGFSHIARDLAASPPVDTAKVERLRAAIQSGEYRPDPDRIAAAMIAIETVPPKD